MPVGAGRRVRRHGTLGRDPTRMAKKWNHCFLELIAPPLQVGIIATVSSNTRQSRLAKNQGRRRCEPGQGAAECGGQPDGGARAAPRQTSSAQEKQRHNAPEKQRASHTARQRHSAPDKQRASEAARQTSSAPKK